MTTGTIPTRGVLRMRQTASSRSKLRRLSAVFGLLPILAFQPASAQWELEIDAELGVIHTDNLTLRSDANGPEDEVLFSVVPSFVLSNSSERITADIRYRPEAYFYDERSEFDEIFHVAEADLTAALVRNALFFYVGGSSYQSIVSPDTIIPTTNVPLSSNQLDIRTWEVRPYWEQTFGAAEVLLELSHLESSFEELDNTIAGFIQDNEQQTVRFDLNNTQSQQRIAWGLNHQYRRIEYEVSDPWEYQRAGLTLGIWAGDTLRLFASGGKETDFDGFLDGDLDDDFWEVGLQYRPNRRLNLEFAGGERTFGDSYRLDMSFELRNGRMTLNYAEEPTTLAETLVDRNPIVDTDNLDTFLDRPGASDQFIRRRAAWSTTINRRRSDFTFRVFFERRDEREELGGMLLADEDQLGASFRWNWRFSGRSTLGVLADYSERETSFATADVTRYGLEYQFQISERLSVRLFGQRSEETGDDAALSDPRYDETQFRLVLRTELL